MARDISPLDGLTVQRELAQLLDTSVQFGIVSSIFSNECIVYVCEQIYNMYAYTYTRAYENVYHTCTSIYSFTVGTGAWISLTHRLV